jgi:DNA repair exonuclease SbcCD ATPase subunit
MRVAREKIVRVEIDAFRGVPGHFDLELPDGLSLIVYGDNATGKSTVVDAIEWYFTGRVDFLAHEGRDHAIRHLNALDEVETRVDLETSGELGGFIVHPVPSSPSRRLDERESGSRDSRP